MAQPLTRSAAPLIICEGWLHKLKQDADEQDSVKGPPSMFAGWLKRYFRIEGDRIFYYHAVPRPGGADKASWSTALQDISALEATVPAQQKESSIPLFNLGVQYIIRMQTPLRPLVVRAENRAEYDRWLQVLRVHVSARRTRAGLPPPAGLGSATDFYSSLGARRAPSTSISGSGMVVAQAMLPRHHDAGTAAGGSAIAGQLTGAGGARAPTLVHVASAGPASASHTHATPTHSSSAPSLSTLAVSGTAGGGGIQVGRQQRVEQVLQGPGASPHSPSGGAGGTLDSLMSHQTGASHATLSGLHLHVGVFSADGAGSAAGSGSGSFRATQQGPQAAALAAAGGARPNVLHGPLYQAWTSGEVEGGSAHHGSADGSGGGAGQSVVVSSDGSRMSDIFGKRH